VSYPNPTELQKVILEELKNLGGKAKLSDLYEHVPQRFPKLTKAELERRVPSGSNYWTGYIRFGLDGLKKKGEIVNLERGVWGISSSPPFILPQAKALGSSEDGFHSFQIACEKGGRVNLVVPVNVTGDDVERIHKILVSVTQEGAY